MANVWPRGVPVLPLKDDYAEGQAGQLEICIEALVKTLSAQPSLWLDFETE